MQRYLITNAEKFTGQAELIFNKEDTLIVINCSDTNMRGETLRHFKAAAPVDSTMLASAFGPSTSILPADVDVTFEMFYNAYPLKRNRYKAEKLWPRLTKAEQVEAFVSLIDYKKYLKREDWQNPMIADSYLSRKEFQTDWKTIKSK